MANNNLEIKNLSVKTGDRTIINDLSLTLTPGSIHVLMGPNGCGKSTLSLALAGHPNHTIEAGTVTLAGKSLLNQDATERSLSGLMLAWQNPVGIPGIKISHFLRLVVNSHRAAKKLPQYSVTEFLQLLRAKMQSLDMKPTFATKNVNDDLSGGEKKRLEMLMASLIEPRFLLLDEIDSGLDIDAIKVVAKQIKQLAKNGTGILLITHYHRLLDYVTPDQVHIILNGKIVKEGDAQLAKDLELSSYEQITNG